MYLTRNQAWAQVHRGFESHPLRQKEKAPIGALSFCGESEHARGWDSKRRACKRGAGRIPYQIFIERIRSDELASETPGESHIKCSQIGFEATSKQVGCMAYSPTKISAKKKKPREGLFLFMGSVGSESK